MISVMIFFVSSWIIGDGPLDLPIYDDIKCHHKNLSLNNIGFHYRSHAQLLLVVYDDLL